MTFRRRVHAAAYRFAYRLPWRLRRRIVRIVMPKFIVGAIVLARDEAREEPGRIVLIRQPPGHGWALPGGLLDRGEEPVTAAARELFEETGVKVDAADLIALHPNAVVHTDGRWIDCVFEARVAADVAFDVDGGEVLAAAWHRLDALPPLTVPTARLLAVYGLGPYVGFPEAQI